MLKSDRLFDTKVQYLKYKVLREVARQSWAGTLEENLLDIPKMISPGKVPTMRCCVYKERAILGERVKYAISGKKYKNVIQVIDIACDECPAAGYSVTDSCRGCLAHRCEDVCPKDAIVFDHNYVAHIDKTKCVECGKCAQVCPYSAIMNRKRPCQNACKIKAISITEDGAAAINEDNCTNCGACVYTCPFGAITDTSEIVDVIEMLKESQKTGGLVYAILAPAIAGQLRTSNLGQLVTGLKTIGFTKVVEAALGADIVAKGESEELAQKGFLTSSCCPAFVSYVKQSFPDMAENISHNLSPMATIAQVIKAKYPEAKTIFIGPCTAKKMEIRDEKVAPLVDAVLTFEELQALFDSREIDLKSLEEGELYGASIFGRQFARCGGLAEAVEEGLKEQGFTDFTLKATACNGIEECRVALLKKSKNILDTNFIEGMACVGGCSNGAGCLSHGDSNRVRVDQYGKKAHDFTIVGAVSNAENI